MSVPSRVIYETAAIVAACLGNPVDLLDLDPLMSTGRRYLDETIDIIWVMQIVFTDDGHTLDARRLVIRDSEDIKLSQDDVVSEVHEDDRSVVFEFVESPDGSGDSYCFIPGQWVEELMKLRARVPTPWLSPKNK